MKLRYQYYALVFLYVVLFATARRSAEQIAQMPAPDVHATQTAVTPSTPFSGETWLGSDDGTAASRENKETLRMLTKCFAIGMTCAFALLAAGVFAWCRRYPAQSRKPPRHI